MLRRQRNESKRRDVTRPRVIAKRLHVNGDELMKGERARSIDSSRNRTGRRSTLGNDSTDYLLYLQIIADFVSLATEMPLYIKMVSESAQTIVSRAVTSAVLACL